MIGKQLEGCYLPFHIVKNPKKNNGSGFYVGSTRRNWRQVNKNVLSLHDYLNIIDYGTVIYNKDIISSIYRPTKGEIKNEIISNLVNNLDISKQIKDDISFSLHLFYLGTRSLYTYQTNKIISKSKSCDYFLNQFKNSRYVKFVEYTKKFRYPINEYEVIDKNYIYTYVPQFLTDIYQYIIGETDEL